MFMRELLIEDILARKPFGTAAPVVFESNLIVITGNFAVQPSRPGGSVGSHVFVACHIPTLRSVEPVVLLGAAWTSRVDSALDVLEDVSCEA